jgi:hypothetical protein
MGSTWQFNVARELMLLQPIPFKSLYISNPKDLISLDFKEEENFLIKSHIVEVSDVLDIAKKFDVRILTSLRNVFSTIESHRRVFESSSDINSLNIIGYSLDCLSDLMAENISFHLSYIDQLNSISELHKETFQIGKFLDITSTTHQIERIASSLSKDSVRSLIANQLNVSQTFDDFDQTTGWHGNHIAPEFEGETFEISEFRFFPQKDDSLARVEEMSVQINYLKRFLLPFIQQRDELIQQRDELIQQRDELIKSLAWKVTKRLGRFVSLFKLRSK